MNLPSLFHILKLSLFLLFISCHSLKKNHPTPSLEKTGITSDNHPVFFEKTSSGMIRLFQPNENQAEIHFVLDISRLRQVNDSMNYEVVFFPENNHNQILFQNKSLIKTESSCLIGKFKLPQPISNSGKYNLKLINLTTAQSITIQEYLQRKNSENKILITDTSGFLPCSPFLHPSNPVKINLSKNTRFILEKKGSDDVFPPPPFIENFHKPDFSWTKTAEMVSDTILFNLQEGSYKICGPDRQFLSGFIITHDAFPGIADEKEMVEATRYIMNKEEFQRCYYTDDRKKAIEEFWKNIGGSKERARELIRQYYNRAIEANRYFTIYSAPGYKTDRGMIYIIFGKPDHLFRTESSEIWHYGKNDEKSVVNFTFRYTDGEYILERSAVYKDFWYQMVDYWRQGKIYVFDR